MTLILWDTQSLTYKRIENVDQIQNNLTRGSNGRPAKCWRVVHHDGKTEDFKQVRFTIDRVEL